ncbi:hypothetical protein RCL1_001208 [Eukaryota sp. TZLM3-RCL]
MLKGLLVLFLVTVVIADTSCCVGERCVFTTNHLDSDAITHLCGNDIESCKFTCDTLPEVSTDSSLRCVLRSTILGRAKKWIDLNIPSNSGKTFDGYRTDSSGFVSYCWSLNKPGENTRTLMNFCDPITKEQLLPGDALLSVGQHVVIFGGWVDAAHTKYTALELSASRGAVSRVTPYPYFSGNYNPVRFKGVC